METQILGVNLSSLDNAGCLAKIEEFINQGGFHHVVTMNAEICYMAQKDQELKRIINQADLVTPDGSGIIWGAEKLGLDIKERVTGVDLADELCARAVNKGWKIYLLGAAPNIAQKAAQNLKAKHGDINFSGIRDGYFKPADEEQIIAEINDSGTDILMVAMGAPRQEIWLDKYRDILKCKVAIGIGGSLDVFAGEVSRAPKWMQKAGLEWLYRIIKEPKRIGRALALPRFVFLVNKTAKNKNK